MTNKEIFEKELNLIIDGELRDFIGKVLNDLPDYFRKIGASTSGNFHPAYTLGEGGLIRHTKAAVGIAKELLRAEIYDIEPIYNDVVYASLLLHDGLKCGMWEDKTAFDHPLLMGEFVLSKAHEYKFSSFFSIVQIKLCIESHMGKWNTKDGYNYKLPTPKSDLQKIVHLADYIASRKCLEYNFNVEEVN
jgi:hypothetical protein